MTPNTQLERLFRTENLPAFPTVAAEILELCQHEQTTLEDLACALERDPELASRFVLFANSSLYNLGEDVETLLRATHVLGIKTIQLMTVAFSLSAVLPRSGDTGFDYDKFWERAVLRAVSGRTLAAAVQSFTDDEAFVAGLFAELGQVVLGECMPIEYQDVLTSAGSAWPTPACEREVLGFDSIDVCTALLRSWNVPESIAQSIELAVRPAPNVKPSASLDQSARVLSLASVIVNVLTGPAEFDVVEDLNRRSNAHFGLNSDAIDMLVKTMDETANETANILRLWLSIEAPSRVLVAARAECIDSGLSNESDPVDPRDPTVDQLLFTLQNEPSYRDEIVDVPSRRAFDEFLEANLDARIAGAVNRPLGMLAIRIDQYADAPDEDKLPLAVGVAELIARLSRKSELLTHYGGGEFAVLFKNGSPFALRALGDRLRRGVAEASFTVNGESRSATVTIGGTCLDGVTERAHGELLVKAAWRYTDKASQHGANVCLIHGGTLRPE